MGNCGNASLVGCHSWRSICGTAAPLWTPVFLNDNCMVMVRCTGPSAPMITMSPNSLREHEERSRWREALSSIRNFFQPFQPFQPFFGNFIHGKIENKRRGQGGEERMKEREGTQVYNTVYTGRHTHALNTHPVYTL